MIYKPSWFRDGEVFVSYAPTVGINKDGEELFIVDAATGTRTSDIDDILAEDVAALVDMGITTPTSRWVKREQMTDRIIAVPVYFDERPLEDLSDLMALPEMADWETKTIGQLALERALILKAGHGSPSADRRTGTIPYIKVSDIRAGQININPTNRVTDVVAEAYWRGKNSGLVAYDLITAVRTSKNIGEFALLMPGQERIVLTKEVLIMRPGPTAPFDNFYLLWAMTLRAVRRQWNRIVFMQTNREDVGIRYREIRIPVPPNAEAAKKASRPFRGYYLGTQELRERFLAYLETDNRHYVFMSSAAAVDDPEPDDTEDV